MFTSSHQRLVYNSLRLSFNNLQAQKQDNRQNKEEEIKADGLAITFCEPAPMSQWPGKS